MKMSPQSEVAFLNLLLIWGGVHSRKLSQVATAGQTAQLTFIAATGDSKTSLIKGRCCSTDKLHMKEGDNGPADGLQL